MRPMSRAAAVVLLLFALPLTARAAAEQKENHEDGTLRFKVPLNAKGERHGLYTAFFPGGKNVQEKCRYENGARTGVRETYDEKGQLVGEQAWVRGRLVCSKSPRMIDATRQQLLKEAAASIRNLGSLANPRAPSPEQLARAVARLNAYRYLADLPADVIIDDRYVNLCQHASELLVKVGSLTHDPSRPAGYDEKAFALGHEGCAQSNLFMGGDAVGSVDAYMDDSDKSNIDRLGHRRWILNPKMAKTGFGMSGKFSAMYSFDASREEPHEYEYVSFPPRGYCPADMFQDSYAWHVSFNPARYTVAPKAKLAIYPVDAKLNRAAKPLELNYEHIDRGGFGISNAIIARPKTLSMSKNLMYEVVVSGVGDKDGNPLPVSYFVSFY